MESKPIDITLASTILPREIWQRIQVIRTRFMDEMRCGPHMTFVEPFVPKGKFLYNLLHPKYLRNTLVEEIPLAAALLKEEFKNFPPFKVKFTKFNYFVFPKSSVLYLEPECEPINAIQLMKSKLIQLFPNCNDRAKRSGEYVPHLSLARFKNEEECKKYKVLLEEKWETVEYTVKEIYLLWRTTINPTEVQYVVPLGNDVTPPHYGPLSKKNDNSKLERTVVILSLPRKLSDSDLMEMLTKVFR